VLRLKELRKKRDNKKAEQCLKRLKDTAGGSDNLMPPIIEAVENYVTVGEISDCLREIWGEYHERL
jgi:methylmalonyl-CoA mutase N-terminal domain/subunit